MPVVLRIGKQGPPGPKGDQGDPGGSSELTTKGDVLAHDGATSLRVPVGADGQVLEADSAATEGVAWKTRPAPTPLTTKGDVLAHDASDPARVPVGADGQVLTANAAAAEGVDWQTPTLPVHGLGSASHSDTNLAGLNALLTDGPVDAASDPRPPTTHPLAGSEHSQSTLAQLNTKLTGGQVDDAGDPRDANAHPMAGSPHTSSTIAEVNTLISDGNVDDSGDPRDPTTHSLAGPEHSSVTLGAFNAKITSGNLDLEGTPRPPLAHALGGHTSDSLANLNAALTDGPVDVAGAPRPPSGTAGGDLGGTFPNPTVDDGADSTAFHVNVSGELGPVTQVAPAGADLVVGERNSDGATRKYRADALAASGPPAAHAIGGAGHTASTIAEFNTLLSDGDVDEAGDARPPTTHAIGTAHSSGTLATLNAVISDANLDDAGDARPPTTHAFAGAEHSDSSLAEVNAKIPDATLDSAGDARPPTSHALAGGEHSASTIAAFNLLLSDANVDDDGDPRPPTAHAHDHGDLSGITANDHHNRAHAILSAGDHSFPGGSGFLRADGVFVEPVGGGGLQVLTYLFSTNTAAGDPGAGVVRFNAVTYAATTTLYIDATASSPTLNVAEGLGGLIPGDLISFAEIGEPTHAAIYRFVSSVDNGGWWTITVVHVDNGGGPLIADAAAVVVNSFLKADHHQNNTVAVTNPGVTDDDAAGYSIGSTWHNVATGEIFGTSDVSAGAAVWQTLSGNDPHALAAHSSSTLAELNAVISDANLDDDGDPRPPTAHSHAHVDITGQTVNDHHNQQHALGGSDHTSATIAELNALISDANVDDDGDPRPPTAHTHAHADTTGKTADDHHNQQHALGGADHSSATQAELNAKVSDADLVAHAGQLGGTPAVPDVRGLRTTEGPTLMTMGAVGDGQLLKRVGSAIVGADASGGGDIAAVWSYSSTTIEADPGGNNVRFDTNSFGTFGEMYISNDPESPDIDFAIRFALISDGDRILIQEANNADNAALVTITAKTDNTTWQKFEFTVDDSAGVFWANNRNLLVSFIGVGGAGGGGLGSTRVIPAKDMESSLTADLAVNANAPLSQDTNNDSLTVARADDTAEEGRHFEIFVPTTATNMVYGTSVRAQTAPGGASTVLLQAYFREVGTDTWSAAKALATIDVGTNEDYVEDEVSQTLVTWGLTVGKTYQVQWTRDGGTLSGDSTIKNMRIGFT